MINAVVIVLCVLCEYITRRLLIKFMIVSHNPGAAFGLMGSSPGIILVLSGIAFAVILCVIYFADIKPLMRLGLSIMAGGALSNLLERFFFGYVIDWIPVPFFNLQYNLADVEIALGALIVLFAVKITHDD